jgi:hypothetical protein
MELPELLTIHLCTILIILVGILFLIKLWPFKKEKVFGSLFFFVLMITILYTFILTLRFPTLEFNLAQWTGIAIPFACFFARDLFLTQAQFLPFTLLGQNTKNFGFPCSLAWLELIL